MSDDYQGALKDLDKVDVLEPNNESTLKTRANVKYMLVTIKEPCKNLTRLMFLNQTMHPL
jgi:hypothetical protein